MLMYRNFPLFYKYQKALVNTEPQSNQKFLLPELEVSEIRSVLESRQVLL